MSMRKTTKKSPAVAKQRLNNRKKEKAKTPARRSEKKAAAKKGTKPAPRKKARTAPDSRARANPPPANMNNSQELLSAIRIVYKEFRAKKIDDRQAKTAGYLLQVAAQIVKVNEQESRIDEIEELIEDLLSKHR